MPPVIQVENLSKRYRLGVIGGGTLREDANRWWAGMRGRPDPTTKVGAAGAGRTPTEGIWALRDVSFEVGEGEVLGIIGRNGAGKSTLLKILSRITAPTNGRAVLRGRVGSLLEVGTGFHPELTGRENIYLNGTILGMMKADVDRRLDEIVAFSEIPAFIDTPVKRYSSGMTVRLAFAVAAHLEPEILIVDEVLAVGDVAFQRKCLRRIAQTAAQGRTVLFVSHNLVTIENLCSRAIVLRQGRVAFDGGTLAALSIYRQQVEERVRAELRDRADRSGSGRVRLTYCSFADDDGSPLSSALSGQRVHVRIGFECSEPMRGVDIAFNLYESEGAVLLNFNSTDLGVDFGELPNRGEFVCAIPRLPLRAGRYFGNLHCAVGAEVLDWVRGAFALDVEDRDVHQTGALIRQGVFVVDYAWALRASSWATVPE